MPLSKAARRVADAEGAREFLQGEADINSVVISLLNPTQNNKDEVEFMFGLPPSESVR
jgi:hypothetical protein